MVVKAKFNPDIFLAAAELREAGHFTEFTCLLIEGSNVSYRFDYTPIQASADEVWIACQAYERLYRDYKDPFPNQIYEAHRKVDNCYPINESPAMRSHRIFMLLFAREFFLTDSLDVEGEES